MRTAQRFWACRIVASFMLCVLVGAGLPTPSDAQEPCPTNGDVDQDGSITAVDAMWVFLQALDLTELSACQAAIADVFPSPSLPDGMITAADALCIFHRSLGSPSCLDDLSPSAEPLAIDAGEDQVAEAGTVVILSGTANALGDAIASYAWTQTGGPSISLVGANRAIAAFVAPDVAGATLTFRFTVTASSGAMQSDDVRVVVSLGDAVALTALYHATDGANWVNNTNWLSDRPIGEWWGVTTDDDGRVVELALFSNGLSGTLPSELGVLSHLVFLNLGNNLRIVGQIPPELGNLSSLRWLDLSRNQLSGEIPAELGNLTNLQRLNLSQNWQLGGFSGGIPPELGSLSDLQSLNLSYSQLSGEIPPELGSLSNLRWLDLSDNQLTGGIPAALGKLTYLQGRLFGNSLSGCIPADYYQFKDAIYGLPPCEFNGTIPPTQLLPPPSYLGLDSFYEKYLDAGGIPVVSSSKVHDDALFRAWDIIDGMLAMRPDIRTTMAQRNIRVAIRAQSEEFCDLPEFSGLDCETAPAVGFFANPIVAIQESFCFTKDHTSITDLLVHEFAHAVWDVLPESFRQRVSDAYEEAIDAGLWQNAYAGTNVWEYWAEAVQAWFTFYDLSFYYPFGAWEPEAEASLDAGGLRPGNR